MRALSVPTDQEHWDCTAFIYISYDISGLSIMNPISNLQNMAIPGA